MIYDIRIGPVKGSDCGECGYKAQTTYTVMGIVGYRPHCRLFDLDINIRRVGACLLLTERLRGIPEVNP